MAQKPSIDARQADFFDVSAAEPPPAKPEPRPPRQNKPRQKTETPLPSQINHVRPEPESLDTMAARLSSAELNELVTALPDPALAHLLIATVRQLRRRLARQRWQIEGGTASPLERAARQLIAELREYGGDDDDF